MTPAATPTDAAPPHAPPAAVRAALDPAPDLPAAERFTRELAHTHYENFSVVTLLLPRHLRQDFCNVYAFCRTADDLGDELSDRGRAVEMLDDLRRRTLACYQGRLDSALFTALDQTVRRHDIPPEPFLDLIDAFAQDQRVRRYE